MALDPLSRLLAVLSRVMSRLPSSRLVDRLGYNVRGTWPAWAWGPRSAEADRVFWTIEGRRSLLWRPETGRAHADHLEMSGLESSAVISYGVDRRGRQRLRVHVVFPRLRTWPDNTHASFHANWDRGLEPRLIVDGRRTGRPRPLAFRLDGRLSIESTPVPGLSLERSFLPDPEGPALHETWTLTNRLARPLELALEGGEASRRRVVAKGGPFLAHTALVRWDGPVHLSLEPGASASLRRVYTASSELASRAAAEDRDRATEAARLAVTSPILPGSRALAARDSFLAALDRQLVLETPEPLLDTAFAFAKIRAAESVFRTAGGLMHSPGGADYYAAIWTNDQCEYSAPFFPWLGWPAANEASANCYRLFGGHMDPGFGRPLPSSIIAEGRGSWAGAGDRGDAAMYAAGAARFLLASGDRALALELWPRIEWAIEWGERRRVALADGSRGPVLSDSDELEGRLSSGAANLNTQCLHRDGLLQASRLAAALGLKAGEARYATLSEGMAKVIEEGFGAEVHGRRGYRYFEGCGGNRAWTCHPLAVGLHGRAEGTLESLLGPAMWTVSGLRTAEGGRSVWDRSTLYLFRGALASGVDLDRSLGLLRAWLARRITGDHVPYAVEAYPEGNRRHLAAESALLCRVFTEGLFGLEARGFGILAARPRLPSPWDRMSLRGIHAFSAAGLAPFDLEVSRSGSGRLALRISRPGKKDLIRTIQRGGEALVALDS